MVSRKAPALTQSIDSATLLELRLALIAGARECIGWNREGVPGSRSVTTVIKLDELGSAEENRALAMRLVTKAFMADFQSICQVTASQYNKLDGQPAVLIKLTEGLPHA
jgi:hypothetical protein